MFIFIWLNESYIEFQWLTHGYINWMPVIYCNFSADLGLLAAFHNAQSFSTILTMEVWRPPCLCYFFVFFLFLFFLSLPFFSLSTSFYSLSSLFLDPYWGTFVLLSFHLFLLWLTFLFVYWFGANSSCVASTLSLSFLLFIKTN